MLVKRSTVFDTPRAARIDRPLTTPWCSDVRGISDGCTDRTKLVVSSGAPGDDVSGDTTDRTDSSRDTAAALRGTPRSSVSAVPVAGRSSGPTPGRACGPVMSSLMRKAYGRGDRWRLTPSGRFGLICDRGNDQAPELRSSDCRAPRPRTGCGRCRPIPSRGCASGRRDSNSRPPAPKAGALPGCATSRGRRHYPPGAVAPDDVVDEVVCEPGRGHVGDQLGEPVDDEGPQRSL